MSKLNGQWALITGASKGLGRELALQFAEAGINLILAARSTGLLGKLKAEVEDRGIECVIVAGNIREDETLGVLKKTALEKNLDILVNNAGVVDITPLEDVSDERIDELLELNLMVPIKLTRAVIGMFKKRQSGVIININSAGGKHPVPDHSIYCASKYGLNGFIESLKLEIKGTGIRVMNICPGKMATELFNAAGRSMDTGKFLPPREIAETVMVLLNMSGSCSHTEFSVDRRS